MSKTNKKSINYGLKILVILAFSLIFIPFHTTKAAYGTNTNEYYAMYQPTVNNPRPFLGSINPKSADLGSQPKTITLTGDNFIPQSVAKVNGANRNTTFIDDSHLLVQLTANDMYQNESLYITVFNTAPGGGYSDAVLFTINKTNNSNNNSSYNYSYNNSSSNYNNGSYSNINQNQNSTNSNEYERYSNIASNVIFGSQNSFLPSGILEWIMIAVVIMIIIILGRKVFKAEENYHKAPLKHD